MRIKLMFTDILLRWSSTFVMCCPNQPDTK